MVLPWNEKKIEENKDDVKPQIIMESKSSIEVNKTSRGWTYGIKLYDGVSGDDLSNFRDLAITMITEIEGKLPK